MPSRRRHMQTNKARSLRRAHFSFKNKQFSSWKLAAQHNNFVENMFKIREKKYGARLNLSRETQIVARWHEPQGVRVQAVCVGWETQRRNAKQKTNKVLMFCAIINFEIYLLCERLRSSLCLSSIFHFIRRCCAESAISDEHYAHSRNLWDLPPVANIVSDTFSWIIYFHISIFANPRKQTSTNTQSARDRISFLCFMRISYTVYVCLMCSMGPWHVNSPWALTEGGDAHTGNFPTC